MLAAMAEQGIAPGVDTINTIMQAALQAGLPAAVPGLFRQLLKGGLSPSAVSYTALVTALTRLDRPADAVRPRSPQNLIEIAPSDHLSSSWPVDHDHERASWSVVLTHQGHSLRASAASAGAASECQGVRAWLAAGASLQLAAG